MVCGIDSQRRASLTLHFYISWVNFEELEILEYRLSCYLLAISTFHGP